MDEVYDFIKNGVGLESGNAIVVGVSGGPDSMALLNVTLCPVTY